MRKLTLALVVVAAGAAAVYYFDPRKGAGRRAAAEERLARWRLVVRPEKRGWQALLNRVAPLAAQGRGLLDRVLHRKEISPLSGDELDPLSFPPQLLEQQKSSRAAVLSTLAVAAPVAMAAVGAAMLKRREDGEWLH